MADLGDLANRAQRELSVRFKQGFDDGSSGTIPDTRLHKEGFQGALPLDLEFGPKSKIYEFIYEKPLRISFEEIRQQGKIPVTARQEPREVKGEYRDGYVAGLPKFMEAKGIKPVEGIVQVTSLQTLDGVEGFLRGINLQGLPGMAITAVAYDKFLERELRGYYEEKPRYVKPSQESPIAQSGYRLGFIVRVAHDSGLVLNWAEIPMATRQVMAFVDGMEANARVFPLDVVRRTPKKGDYIIEKYINSERENPVDSEANLQRMDRMAYHTGLKVWLKSRGVEGVEPWRIDQPEALRAFKAGLEGTTLPEYELIPQIRGRRFENSSKDFPPSKYFNKLIIDFLDKTEPTQAEIARTQAWMAYALGKAAEQKKPK